MAPVIVPIGARLRCLTQLLWVSGLLLTACTSPATNPASPTPLVTVPLATPLPTGSTQEFNLATPFGSATPTTADLNTAVPQVDSPTPPTPLPAGPITVVTLGDSLTEGQGDETNQGGYPGRLQAMVQTVRPEVQIINVGHSGWTSTDVIQGLESQPGELAQALAAQPALALVWIGSNDLWYLYEYGPEPMTEEAELADQQAYAANLDTILGQLQRAGVRVGVGLLDDQALRPVVAHPANPAEPAFPSITAADRARMSQQIKAYNAILQQKAAAYGGFTVDFYQTTLFTDPATLADDGNHPNAAGYDQVTALWFQALAPLLK